MLKEYLDLVKKWLSELGFDALVENESWQVDSIILFLGLGLLGSIATGLYRLTLWWFRRNQQFRLRKDLHPFFSAADIKKATQFYVDTHFQSIAPSQHQELIQANLIAARQRLIPFFLNHAFKSTQDDQRFYIVMAGSGMGKTTFMINLYLAYLQRKRLGRASFQIRLMPLGYPDLIRRIDQIEDPENTILLLDGLDEDPQAIRNYKKRLERILAHVKDFRVVVFTCRTQFFPSEEEEPRETGVVKFGARQGFQTFAKLYLSPFDDRDIRQYLNKRYGFWQRGRKEKAVGIVRRVPNLVVRPMILSYIDDLLDEAPRFEYLTDLYETLIHKWIEREANRVPEDRREVFLKELYTFSQAVAINIFKHRRHRKGLFIGLKEIRKVGDQHALKLEDMELQTRSLLNRNVFDQYKFAHKSILEYFLAKEAIRDPRFASQLNEQGLDIARRFYAEMCLLERTYPLFSETKSRIQFKTDADENWKAADSLKKDQVPYITDLKAPDLTSLEPLAPLVHLRSLYAPETDVEDLTPLAGLPALEALHLNHTGIHDLKALALLPGLKTLELNHTRIRDLSPLRKHTALHHLSADATFIEKLDALELCVDLEILLVGQTQVRDLSPLRKLRRLRVLNVSQTAVNALGPIRDLSALTYLDASHTHVAALGPIRNLKRLEHLDLSATEAQNLSPLKPLLNLQHLSLDQTPVEDLSPLAALSGLRVLSLKGTRPESLAPLFGLSQLSELYLSDHPRLTSDLEALRRELPNCEVRVHVSM